MMARTQSWPVPYLSKLEGGGVQPGQSLVVRGVVLGERFDINFATGRGVESGESDIPLHLSVRVKEKDLVFNSKKDGEWGKEVRCKNPFKTGEPFDLRIRAHDNKFEVFANQKEVKPEYEYRQPLSTITHLFIEGEVEIHAINWGGKYYPVPYQAGVPGGLVPGKRLFVSGVPEKKGNRFDINLLLPNGDIALHFNVRFDEKAVVRNSKIGDGWQNEEREGKLTLKKEEAFDLIIVNEPYAFQIFLNGEHYCAFAHRTPPDQINGLQIDGDVELQGVHIK